MAVLPPAKYEDKNKQKKEVLNNKAYVSHP
jgi:hypothetical protein